MTEAKQGQWLNWESVEKKKLSWKDVWNMEESHIRFLIGTTCDVLPTPENLKLWLNRDHCACCVQVQQHLSTSCQAVKLALSQDWYAWRHNHVLKRLATGIENRRRKSLGRSKKLSVGIQFVCEREKYRGDQSGEREFGCLEAASDWEIQVDLGRKQIVSQDIVITWLRPDIVLWSLSRRIVYLIELHGQFPGKILWKKPMKENTLDMKTWGKS